MPAIPFSSSPSLKPSRKRKPVNQIISSIYPCKQVNKTNELLCRNVVQKGKQVTANYCCFYISRLGKPFNY